MGDEVKGFIIKNEFSEGLAMLSDAQLGAILRGIMAESNGEVCEPKDPLALIMFKTIMPSIRAAQDSYARRIETSRENGKKGGRPKKQAEAEQEEPTGYSENQSVISENQTETKTETQKPTGYSENQSVISENPDQNLKTRIEGNRREGNRIEENSITPHTPLLGGACEGEVIDDPNIPPSQKAKGKHPTVAEVAAYCNARGNTIDPQTFVDYFTAQGWKLSNGRPLKDWQAAVRTWEQRRKQDSRNNSRVQFHPSSANAVSQHNMAVMNRVLAEMGDM